MSYDRIELIVYRDGYANGYADPDAILAALAEAGVLIEENDSGYRYIEATGGEVHGPAKIRYVSPWKEAK